MAESEANGMNASSKKQHQSSVSRHIKLMKSNKQANITISYTTDNIQSNKQNQNYDSNCSSSSESQESKQTIPQSTFYIADHAQHHHSHSSTLIRSPLQANKNKNLFARFQQKKQEVAKRFMNREEVIIGDNLECASSVVLNRLHYQNRVGDKKLLLHVDFPSSLRKIHHYKETYHDIPRKGLKELYLAKCLDLQLQPNKSGQQLFLDGFARQSSSTRLVFINQSFNLNSAIILKQILSLHGSNITHLILPRNKLFGNSLKIFLQTIGKLSRLIHLDLSQNCLDQFDIEILLRKISIHPSIISLNLSNADGVHENRLGQRGALAIKKYLQTNKIIEFLKLCGLSLDTAFAATIFDGLLHNKSLISLDLSENFIKNLSYLLLKVVPTTQMEEIFLNKNNIGDDGLIELKAFYTKNHHDNSLAQLYKKLKCVQLSNNDFSLQSGEFFMMLVREKTLNSITFDNNHFDEQTEQAKLGRFLSENKALQCLSLQNCHLLRKGGKQLARGLQGNQCLQQININGNYIGDEIMCDIFQALLNNTNLKQLSTARNKIGQYSCVHFCNLVKTSPTLITVDLSCNYLGQYQVLEIRHALQSPKSVLQELNMKENLCDERAIEGLEAILHTHQRVLMQNQVPLLQNQICKITNLNIMYDTTTGDMFEANAQNIFNLQQHEVELQRNPNSKQSIEVNLDNNMLIELEQENKKLNECINSLRKENIDRVQYLSMDKTSQKGKNSEINLDKRKVMNMLDQLKKKMSDTQKRQNLRKEAMQKERVQMETRVRNQLELQQAMTSRLKEQKNKFLGLYSFRQSMSSRKSIYQDTTDLSYKIQARVLSMRSHKLYKMHNPNAKLQDPDNKINKRESKSLFNLNHDKNLNQKTNFTAPKIKKENQIDSKCGRNKPRHKQAARMHHKSSTFDQRRLSKSKQNKEEQSKMLQTNKDQTSGNVEHLQKNQPQQGIYNINEDNNEFL